MNLTRITPELAQEWIGNHYTAWPADKPLGRAVIPEKVARFARLMRNGEWSPQARPDWKPIVIAGPGELWPPGTVRDGWHRLNAVVLSGATIMEYVA